MTCNLEYIILDIDYTLLFSMLDKEDEDDLKKMKINIRPHLKEFLEFLFKNFKGVSIWSAGGPEYVKYIVKYLKKNYTDKDFKFVYTSLQTTIDTEFGKRGFIVEIQI